AGAGAYHSVLRRGGVGDLPDDRQRADRGAAARLPVLPADADLPLAGAAGARAAADEVDDPVRGADPDGRLSAGGGGGPDADVQPDGSGAGADPAHAVQVAGAAQVGVLLGAAARRGAAGDSPPQRGPGRAPPSVLCPAPCPEPCPEPCAGP